MQTASYFALGNVNSQIIRYDTKRQHKNKHQKENPYIHQYLEFAMQLFFLNTLAAYKIFLLQDLFFIFFSWTSFYSSEKENTASSEGGKKKERLSLIMHELIPECRKKVKRLDCNDFMWNNECIQDNWVLYEAVISPLQIPPFI